MANLITLSRLLLLLAVIAIIYNVSPLWQLVNIVLLILVFVTDALDGYVARRRGESSRFGAIFDIASDRIVEWSLWIVFVDLDLVPLWVLLVFIVRGVLVDAIRSSVEAGSPFESLLTPVGRWLVAGRFMRAFYAVLKAVTFCLLLLSFSLSELERMVWIPWTDSVATMADVLVLMSVVVCLARGLPVIIEFVYAERRSLIGNSNQNLRQPGAG